MRWYFKVRGTVQGIGYRLFVSQTAKQHALTGWVKNCSNGDVEGEAQGLEKSLNQFLNQLQTGHAWAEVDEIVHETLSEKPEEKGFQIKF
jgi:acylphosphatase